MVLNVGKGTGGKRLALVTEPTEIQKKAFALLEVKPKKSVAVSLVA